MKFYSSLLLISLLCASLFACRATPPSDSGSVKNVSSIAWTNWSDDVFARARAEHKFVLLDLHAVWCHWCHVMDENTYSDPAVIALIARHYIPVSVDADARPDLANRYEDYGWPATIVFAPDGTEIAKRQGYLPPKTMSSMLQAIIDDPTPGPSVRAGKQIDYTDRTSLADDVRRRLTSDYVGTYDSQAGGWGTIHKYLDWDSVEWSMHLARRGDTAAERRAVQTLHAQLALIDPVWGGVYQYSTDGDWIHPHFEKIMQFQAENLRIYALAYLQFHNAEDLQAAQAIRHFMMEFLRSQDGGFYTSMDADPVPGRHGGEYFKLSDAERRHRGIPRIDQHQYARENGWAISGLTALYAAGDADALNQAQAAAHWALTNRALPGGGFRHDLIDPAGPYLGDTLAMGRAFLNLYAVTADRQWLNHAEDSAAFIRSHFMKNDAAGVTTSTVRATDPLPPTIELDENVATARFANLLFRYAGNKADRALADVALRYLGTPEIAGSRHLSVAGILLADAEGNSEPLHLTVVGAKSSPDARDLFQHGAIAIADAYKRVDWFDPAGPPLPNTDTTYPEFRKPAVFLCAGAACSRPAFTLEDLQSLLAKARE